MVPVVADVVDENSCKAKVDTICDIAGLSNARDGISRPGAKSRLPLPLGVHSCNCVDRESGRSVFPSIKR